MTSTKNMRVLLVDTAFAALPVYEFLARSGYDVYVMGNRPNDVLAQKAGELWIDENYSDIDAVRTHMSRLEIETVVPGCTDVSIETCISLMGGTKSLDTPEVNFAISNKAAFRKICKDLDLPSPVTCELTDFPRQGSYICKPVDSYSGKGISVVDGEESIDVLLRHYEYAKSESPTAQAIFESFIDGQLYSFSAFVENNKVVDYFLVKEGCSTNPYAVDTSYVDNSLPSTVVDVLRSSIQSISTHLNMTDGLIHTQFIFNGESPMLIEMSRRCPGDLYPVLIEASTGYPYGAKFASYFVSEHVAAKKTQEKHIIRHTVTSDEDKVFGGLVFNHSQPTCEYYPLQTVGQMVKGKQQSRIAIMFSEYQDSDERDRNYDRFMSRAMYVIR